MSKDGGNQNFGDLKTFESKEPKDSRIWIRTGVESLARKCRIVDDTNDGKTNPVLSTFNVVNANLGNGILAMPFVIRLVGYWGILITVLIGIIGNYTGKNLVSLLYEETEDGCRVRVRDSYADIGECFSPRFGRYMVHIVNCIEQFSHCVLPLIMPGTIIAHTFPKSGMSESIWILLFSVFVVPSIFFRKMHQVTWTSIVTVLTAIVISIVFLVYCFLKTNILSNRLYTSFDIHAVPTAFGIVMATFSSQAYLPSIERCMREPELFNPIMNFAYTFLTVLKITVGILVCLAFTDETDQIMTLNLPRGVFGDIVNITAIIVSLSFYTVPMFTVFDILENQIEMPKFCKKLLDNETTYCGNTLTACLAFRFAIVVAFIAIAAGVPHFSLMMSFVGNTTGTILVLLYPSLFYVKIRWKNLSIIVIIGNSCIVVMAIVSIVLGVNATGRAFHAIFTDDT